jgi:hypothetical protein
MPQTPAKVERKRASMDAIQVPMPAVCGPEKAPCSPDWLPRPVDGWPDRCSPTTEHVAGADDAQPAQQQQQHRQHHELVRRRAGQRWVVVVCTWRTARAAGDTGPGWSGGLRGRVAVRPHQCRQPHDELHHDLAAELGVLGKQRRRVGGQGPRPYLATVSSHGLEARTAGRNPL